MAEKKQKKAQKHDQKQTQIITNRGKPSDIQTTILQIPNIWTNDQICLKLIKYLSDIGRHICLHQAGKPNPDNKYQENKTEIKNTRDYYELSEKFADELFGHKCETKRCIVFFFRSSKDEKVNNFELIRQKNLECEDILIKVSALFSQRFFEDLIYILTFNGKIQQLIEDFLSPGKTPQSYSHIIQNIYIKHMIDDMKEKKSKQSFDLKTRGDKESNFYNFIQSQNIKDEVEKFIKEIKLIFNRENDQYETEDDRIQEMDDFQDNYNSYSYLSEKIEYYREQNQFLLDPEF